MSDVIKNKKTILREHRVALDRQISVIRRGAKAALKKQVEELETTQYARLTSADSNANIEELYHDIETQIKEGTEDIMKNGPTRLEGAIQKLRVDNLMSCQAAINEIDEQLKARALAKANEVGVKIETKTDRVTQPA